MVKITTETIQEFMDMLTGSSLPEGITMGKHQPQLTEEQAFSVIWYLQEHLGVLPDNFEMCHVCGTIFDTHREGYIVSDDYDSWYEEQGVSKGLMLAHEGRCFCDIECEARYWGEVLASNGTETTSSVSTPAV